MHPEQRERIFGRERSLASDHLEQHDAERVEVRARIDRAAGHRLLGRHVVRRTDDHVRLGCIAANIPAETRETEVEDAHAFAMTDLVGDHDVRGLHIAMDDALLVRVREARRDLACERERLARR